MPTPHPNRHDHDPRAGLRPPRRRVPVAALLALLALTGSASAAAIRVAVVVGESGRPPIVSGDRGDGAVFSDGTPHAGGATYLDNHASFDVAPQFGRLSLTGGSAFTTFAEWGGQLRETVASGQFEISDSFRVEGPIAGTVAGAFVARVNGTLLPNLDFEEAYHLLRGDATLTASSRTILLLAQRTPEGVVGFNRLHDQVGSFLGSGSPCGGCQVGTDIAIEFVIPLLISDDSREFSFNLNSAAVGTRGGGFAFGSANLGPALAAFAALSADASATTPVSALSFELRLPAGLSFSSGGGNFLHLAPIEPDNPIPEPPLPALLVAAGALAAGVRRSTRKEPGRA